MSMTIGSLFAGIGGFDLGFERAGFKTLWQCEIDKSAQGVLRRHFPDAKLHSDVREVGAHNLEPVDVLTFGSPCQDLSVAGKRAGLAGERSGLFHEAVRIIRELRERYGKPDFAIWENVPGAFSSNGGADFAAVVQAMVDLGARDICWRVLDSRYFGVAQRRRRVFLVADFGGERAEQILFEPESLRGDSAPSRKARKGAASGAGAGAKGSSREWPAKLSSTLNTAFGTKMGLEDQHALAGAPMFVPTQPIPCDGSTDGLVPTLIARSKRGGAQTLSPGYRTDGHCIAHPIPMVNMQGSKGNAVAQADGPSYTLQAMHGHDVHAVALPLQEVGKRTGVSTTDVRAGIGIGQQDDPMFTLQATAQHGVAVGFAQNSRDEVRLVGGDGRIVGALDAHRGTKQTTYIAQPLMQVRRLTPQECEALQAFPRNWTAEARFPDGTIKPQADGHRYKQLGNAVTVNVAEWIAKRLAATLTT